MRYVLLGFLPLALMVACGPYVIEHKGEVTVKVTIEDLYKYFEIKCAIDKTAPEEISNCISDSLKDFANIVGVNNDTSGSN
jgi:hypothetical protein